MKLLFLSALVALLPTSQSPASLVVDSFTEGEHFLSLPNAVGTSSYVTSPFGSVRAFRLSGRLAAPGTTMTSELSTARGELGLEIHGTSIDTEIPLYFKIEYFDGGPYSLAGYSSLELDFSAVSGTGFLIVELGSESETYGPEANRVTLSGPGMVDVPFGELNFGASGTIESFYVMRYRFEAASEDFSFVLDEVRAVPEPTSFACHLLGAVALLTRRRAQRRARGGGKGRQREAKGSHLHIQHFRSGKSHSRGGEAKGSHLHIQHFRSGKSHSRGVQAGPRATGLSVGWAVV